MMKKNLISSLFVILVSLLVVTGTGMAQDWDGASATNNDDGGSDSNTDTSTSSTNGWDGGSATNDNDGSSTKWDGGAATNNDDGGSTANTWDGESATNDDDRDTSDSSSETDSSSSRGGSGGGEIHRADVQVLEPVISVDMPESVAVGQTVDVTGHVEYPRVRDIDIYVDGELVQTTRLNDAYDFSTQFTAETAGEHTVEIRTREASVERQLYVTTSVEVSNLDLPATVDSGRNVDICADVSSAANPDVILTVDGVEVASQTGTGRVCFEVDLSQGTHTVNVVANVEGDRDVQTGIITVTGDGTDSTAGDLSDNPRTSAGIFQSMINMLTAMVAFIVQLVPIV
ncbi:hypothetical protein [Candidatus Nanohalococcus occultus]|uniref:hypothetical protein n=1 Tax=Candidatus Nanohalococcus occultus TaxID=2978047 RepID=UPI0039E1B26C